MKKITLSLILFFILLLSIETLFAQNQEILFETGNEYFIQSKYSEALKCYKKASAMETKEENLDLLGNLFHNIAYVYQILGSYELALENYHTALKYKEENKDILSIASTFNNLGIVYHLLHKYEEALKYYKKALSIRKKHNKLTAADTYNNIGIAYLDKNKLDSSLIYYKLGLEIYQQKNDWNGVASVLTNIALVYKSKNEDNKALKNCIEAYNIIDTIGNNHEIANIALNLGSIYLKLKKYDEALVYLEKTINLAQKSNSTRLIIQAYLSMFELFKEKNELNKAVKYIELYTELNDSINNQAMLKKTTEMQIVYETEKKEKENQKLINEKKIKNIWLYSISIAFVITLILGIYIFIQNTKISKAHNILVHRNIEVVESENKLKETKFELETIIENKSTIELIVKEKQKYNSSTLSNKKKDTLLSEITVAMEEEKMFLQADLTTKKLAVRLKTNKNYISQIINETFNTNFSNFINEYRIKEARILLLDSKKKHLTIEAIANEVGFKSRPSFNKAFKKFVGVTPSFFIKNS